MTKTLSPDYRGGWADGQKVLLAAIEIAIIDMPEGPTKSVMRAYFHTIKPIPAPQYTR